MLESLLINFKKTPTQVFSCDYCDISKNSCFYGTPLVAAYASKKLIELLLKENSLTSIWEVGFSFLY